MLDRLARVGLVFRGVLYALIGILAVQISFGQPAEDADDSGAISTIAAQPFGTVVLSLMLVGFVALALLQLLEVLLGMGSPGARVVAAARTVLYGILVATIATLLFAGDDGDSGNEQARDLTAWAMGLPGGRFLVAVAGLVVLGVGLHSAYLGLTRRFLADLRTHQLSGRARTAVAVLGAIGYPARGVIMIFAGVFLGQAAVEYDPDEAKGVDATLRSFAETGAGPWLLTVIAVGLLVFAAYCCFDARYRRL